MSRAHACGLFDSSTSDFRADDGIAAYYVIFFLGDDVDDSHSTARSLVGLGPKGHLYLPLRQMLVAFTPLFEGIVVVRLPLCLYLILCSSR